MTKNKSSNVFHLRTVKREERAHALFGLQKELQEFSDLIIAKHRLEKKNE